MIILATVAKKTFDGGKILPLYSLDRSQLNVISTELVKIVQKIFEQNKRNKFDSFLFEKLHPEEMTEVNSLVNSILQVCYPFISMDRLWTDMHCILEPDKAINIKLYPAYIPEEEIFKTMVYVGKTRSLSSYTVSTTHKSLLTQAQNTKC